MARAITQDMDRPSLHSLHNHNRNSSTHQEINSRASVVDDERVAEVAVTVDTAVMVDSRTCPS